MCAVTFDALTNGSTCVVLRPSGAVITMDCYERLVKTEMVDPTTGRKFVIVIVNFVNFLSSPSTSRSSYLFSIFRVVGT